MHRLGKPAWSPILLLETILVEIPTLELFLRQNPQPDDSQGEWSFGQVRYINLPRILCFTLTSLKQILALIGIVPALVSVVMPTSSAIRGEIEDVVAPVSTEED